MDIEDIFNFCLHFEPGLGRTIRANFKLEAFEGREHEQ
jgi:hypothetical protein